MTKSGKHCDKKRNYTFCATSSFVTMFSKSCLLQRRQKASICGKGLILLVFGIRCGRVVSVGDFETGCPGFDPQSRHYGHGGV